jgi:hypothetical protein
MTQTSHSAQATYRNVVLGCNSQVWQQVRQRQGMSLCVEHAIGHRELNQFCFTPLDRIWVFSYSRSVDENTQLLNQLACAGVAQVVYISSSSTIVCQVSQCYEYPRVKYQAQRHALTLAQTKVLTIGLMFDHLSELPNGPNVATSYDELAAFMLAPDWPDENGRGKHLFKAIHKPFHHVCERWAHALYGQLLQACGRWPCMLRPFDFLLRTFKLRWYGYVYLSNKRWLSTSL